MGRIERAFEEARHPLFIPFIVAGDPDPEQSFRIACTIIDAGAGVLELGIPFSDPSGDGPAIQRGDDRALRAGTTPRRVFELTRRLRQRYTTPMVILTYYNIVYQRGIGQFYQEAAQAGVDGVIVADLPIEEAGEVLEAASSSGIAPIFLVAPTTSNERAARIASRAGGFLYLVSRTGVTGVQDSLSADTVPLIQRMRMATTLPLAVGFGLSAPEQAKEVCLAGARGVIVGSAIVSIIARYAADETRMHEEIGAFVRGMNGVLQEMPENVAGREPC